MSHPLWDRRRSANAAAVLAVTALLASAGAAAADDPADDAGPLFAAVRTGLAEGRLARSQPLGFDLPNGPFKERPSDPGVLVGFDLGVGKFFDIDTVCALRAVYWTPNGDEVLADHGLFQNTTLPKRGVVKTRVVRTVHLRAQPGYAVGGVRLRSGLNMNGLSVTFMRIKGRRLDPLQSYESAWVGDRTGGGEDYMGGDGAPVVGVFGSQDEEHVSSLGLYFLDEPAPLFQPAAPLIENPAPADAPPQDDAPKEAAQPASPPAKPASPPPAATAEPTNGFLLYGLPAAAFVAVTGIVLVITLTSLNRKGPPPLPAARRPDRAERRPAVAVPPRLPPADALTELPSVIPVHRSRPADDVLELGPDDFEPEPPPEPHRAETPKPPPPPSDGWPRLEL